MRMRTPRRSRLAYRRSIDGAAPRRIEEIMIQDSATSTMMAAPDVE
jgi:hypothetical protein